MMRHAGGTGQRDMSPSSCKMLIGARLQVLFKGDMVTSCIFRAGMKYQETKEAVHVVATVCGS